MKKPHTTAYPGKRVRVKLHDGTVLFDKFVDSNDRWIILRERGKVLVKDIDSFGLAKVDRREERKAS